MTKYTVTSDRLAGHDRGDTVTGDDLAANLDALVAAGHLERAPSPKKSPSKEQ